PIEFNFRWATGDAQAHKPVADHNDPDLIINETTAVSQCVGNFAALRMLQKYRTNSVNAEQLSPNQIVLGFKIPLSNGKDAKIYVGVTASIPKQPGEPSVTTLKIPITAGKAPEIPPSVMAVAREAVLINKIMSSPFPMNAVDELDHAVLGVSDDDKPDTKKGVGIKNKGESAPANKTKKSGDTVRKESISPKAVSRDTQEREEVLNILKSDKLPETSNEETLVEVAEEPIG
ncbi:MAG: hypothetical protein LBJ42_01990, partial [Holosporales bacterium]|nr:hypothetical protein [Holosporales bacterium]